MNSNVCNFKYLSSIVNNKNHLKLEIINVFLKQVPEDLENISQAITNIDYGTIERYSHTMISSMLTMGISLLNPILLEMEELGKAGTDLEKINALYLQVELICQQAFKEIENERLSCLQSQII
jgi:HPt (histidine-containing phosphotransfer) domain-containing protein